LCTPKLVSTQLDSYFCIIEERVLPEGYVDSLAGGDGIDTILIGTTATAVDISASDVWTGITDVEVIKAAANSAAVTIALDVSAQTSGLYKVDLSDVTLAYDSTSPTTITNTTNVINVSTFTLATDATLIGPSATTSQANITGGAGADIITAAGRGGVITGGLGADTINGGAGADTLIYALTADLFADSASVDSIKGGADAYVAGSNQGDILKVGTAGAAAGFAIANDDSWARITGVETIVANTTSGPCWY
jgi:S-layer protein